MNRQEYDKINALNQSLFKRWLKSPDNALIPYEDSEAMMFGRYFEDMLEAHYTGKSIDIEYIDIAPQTFAGIVISGKAKKSGKNKDISEYIVNSGNKLAPNDWKILFENMFENLQKAEITKGEYQGYIINGELSIANWQKIITTELDSNGFSVPVKGIIDAQTYVYDTILNLDIKTVNDLDRFKWQYRDGYYVQDYFYTQMTGKLNPNMYVSPLIFVVAEKKEPFNTAIFYNNSNQFEYWQYEQLSKLHECWEWILNGKPKRGFRDTILL